MLQVIRKRINEEFKGTEKSCGVKFKYNYDHFLKPKRGDPCRNDPMTADELVTALLFADDLSELNYDLDSLKTVLEIMDSECARFGLYVSFKKTFVQEWPVGKKGVPELVPDESAFTVTDTTGHDHDIIIKQKFKALGLNLDNVDPDGYISHRIALATGQFQKYRGVLTDFRIKKWVRKKFAESYVRSTLLYAVNAECPTEAQIGQLSSAWYYFLRQMAPGGFAAKKNDAGEDLFAFKYTSKDLEKYFETPPIRDFIHSNYLNYIGHIVRRPNNHPTKKALFIKPERPHAPNVWTKIKFLFNNVMTREDIIRKMMNRTTFQQLLQNYFPHLKKKKRSTTSQA